MNRSKILLVEDDGDLADRIAEPLRRDGFDVTVTGGAAGTVERAFREAPSVILFDTAVRNGNAYRVLERVRLFPELARTRLVALTRGETMRAKRRAQRAGVDYFLEKPVEAEELRSLVARLTGRRSGGRGAIS